MKISGLTVSVGYSDMLSLGIGRWLSGLDSLIVVTDMKDEATPMLCHRYGVPCIRTNVFYERGATFNKAAAMQQARAMLPADGWHLFVDADIVPPDLWYECVEDAVTSTGTIYGAWRYAAKDQTEIFKPDLPRFPNDEPNAGWFQLFHSQDPRAAAPLDEFTHAGVYDSLFARRWPAHRRAMIDGLRLVHVGERDNWWGRGNTEAFKAMQAERRKRGGWEHERVR